jgi:RimJ/RimL family protein N-acetyltransferase
MPPLILTTPHLTLIAGTSELTRMEISDQLHFARLLNASIPESWPLPLEDVQSMEPDAVGWGVWYFVRSEGLVAVGGGAFKGMPTEDGTVEVGYSVLPEHQGRGYATGAVGAMVEWALAQQNVMRVIAETLPEFASSIRVLGKLGFRQVPGGSDTGVIRFERQRDTNDPS